MSEWSPTISVFVLPKVRYFIVLIESFVTGLTKYHAAGCPYSCLRLAGSHSLAFALVLDIAIFMTALGSTGEDSMIHLYRLALAWLP